MSFAKESARDTGKAVVIGLSPDVCLTPVGNSVVPVPYMVHATLNETAANTASSVNMTDQPAYNTGSFITLTVGDAPGREGGIKSGTAEGKCDPLTHAPNVNIEGKPLIRNGDTFEMNNGNTIGDMVFAEDVAPNIVDMSDAGAKFQQIQLSSGVFSGAGASSGAGGALPGYEQMGNAIIDLLRYPQGQPHTTIFVQNSGNVYGNSMGEDLSASSFDDPIGQDLPDFDRGLPADDFTEQMRDELPKPHVLDPEDNSTDHTGSLLLAFIAARITRRTSPCKQEAKGDPNANYRGGAHGDMVGNYPTTESHHMPANAVSPLSKNMGPAIQMAPRDHWRTASWGSSSQAMAYRTKQATLIQSGNFMAAIAMDVADIRSKFGVKYDYAIAQMEVYAACLKRHGIIQ